MTDMEASPPAPPKPRRPAWRPPPRRSNILFAVVLLIAGAFTVVSGFFIVRWRYEWAQMRGEYDAITEWRRRAWHRFERGRLYVERAERVWLLNVSSEPGRDPGIDIRTLGETAIGEFEETLRLYADYHEARDWAGRAATAFYRYDLAVPYFTALLDRIPRHACLYDRVWCRALTYVRRWAALPGVDLEAEPATHRLYSTALRDVRQFVQERGADDRHTLVVVLLAVLTDDLVPALYDGLDNMEQFDPTDWRYRFMRAWLLLHDGRPDEAIAEGRRLFERFPRAVEGWAIIARAQEMLERADDAIESWTRAIELDERFAEAYFARARLRRPTEPGAADQDELRALELAPELSAFAGE